MIRIVHLSDFHFSRFSFNPLQFFSKRWLGNLNFLFNRGRVYLNEKPFSLLEIFKEKNIDAALITGDITTTSYKKEFLLAETFIQELKKAVPISYLLPGNHDHYTKRSYRKKLFYKYFPDLSLKEKGVSAHQLTDKWWLVLMDTTKATSLPYSTGEFTQETQRHLEELLDLIPRNKFILLANHFPFFEHENPKRILKRGRALEKLLRKYTHVKLYLHGHTHRLCLADLRENGLPIILDSGSCSHAHRGSWSLLTLSENQLMVETYLVSKQKENQQCIQSQCFNL